MQMSYFHETLMRLSLNYVQCSLKRCIIHVYILNGHKVMQFWHLKGPFHTTAIIYRMGIILDSTLFILINTLEAVQYMSPKNDVF